jgi:hypothetical protein
MAKGEIRTGSAPLKKVLEMMLEDMGCSEKLQEARVLTALPDILGDGIMKKVDRFYIHESRLFLKISSAPMKHELFLMKEAILGRLNEPFEEDVVTDIVFR